MSVQASDSAVALAPAHGWTSVKRGFADPLGRLGFGLVLVLLLAAIFADVITVYEPTKMLPRDRFQSPSYEHLLGTDQLGRDLFSRMIHGGRVALMVAFPAIGISLAARHLLRSGIGLCPEMARQCPAAAVRRHQIVSHGDAGPCPCHRSSVPASKLSFWW